MKTTRLAVAAIFGFCMASTLHAQPGSLDMTFNPGSGADGDISCMALQTNGQIVIGGDFTHYNGANQNYIARLNADGSLDSSFNPGVDPNGGLGALAVEPNGEIYTGGGFSSWNGVSWFNPICLRTDGSVNTSFNTSADGAPGDVAAIVLQADGRC